MIVLFTQHPIFYDCTFTHADGREANETVTEFCGSTILSYRTIPTTTAWWWCAVRLFRETDLYLSGRKITLNIIGRYQRAAQQRRPRVYYDAVQERFKLYLDADTRARSRTGFVQFIYKLATSPEASQWWRRCCGQFNGEVPSGMYKQSVVRDMHFRLAWR